MSRKILYLDQNFISNLAKVENDLDWKDSQRSYYKELLTVIRSRIEQNRLACPTSYFHQNESELSDRVKGFVWHVAERLSNGLSFRNPNQIFYDQITLGAYNYCGRKPTSRPLWSIPFDRDPNRLDELKVGRVQIMVHLESPEELIENNRNVNALVCEVYEKFKASRRGKSQSFEEEVEFQKLQILAEAFLPPELLLQSFPQLDNDYGHLGSYAVSQEHRRVLKIIDGSPNQNGFWTSKELLECPYLRIRASLMAADIFLYPNKPPTQSLNTDFDIVSSVLPYVDMLATDKHMAELIRQAKLTREFETQVYSMSSRTELLEALREL